MKSFFTWLAKSPNTAQAWLLLALSAFCLELTALYFQYGMNLQPCIMCIYQRVAVLGLVFAGLIGAFGYQQLLARLVAFITWAVSAIWGLIIALEHVDIQSNASSLFFTCEFVPNFPSWLPLHHWIPALFEATGDCGEIDWSFASLSMPEWMTIIFALYTGLLALVVLAHVTLYKQGK